MRIHGPLRAAVLCFAFGLLGCGDDATTFDAGGDSGPSLDGSVDSSLVDAGPEQDASPDAGNDAGPDPDAGNDAGPLPDAGPGMAILRVVLANERMGGGIVTSDTTIDCGSTCTESVVVGTMVTLTANADDGSDFLGFESSDGTTCPALGDCTIEINENTTVTARFDGGPPPVTLSVVNESVRAGGGTVTSNTSIDCGSACEETLDVGTVVTLSGTADAGSTFLGFTGGGCPAAGDCTLTLAADTTVTARFDGGATTATVTVVNASVRSGGGTITSDTTIDCGATCSETVERGTVVTFSAAALGGSDFVGFVSSDGTSCPAMGDCTITINEDTRITGTFDGGPVTGVLSVVIEGRRGGDGNVVSNTSLNCGGACSETIPHGTDVTLMAVPDAGSQFIGFESSDGTDCAAAADCTINLSEDTIVTARFLANPIVTFDPSARDVDVRLRYDNMGADLDDEGGAVRSTASIAPGSGVFYFEGERLFDRIGGSAVGVASSTDSVHSADNESCGQNTSSFTVSMGGGINYDGFGGFFPQTNDHFGFVVDYRGANPTIYLIIRDGGEPIVHTRIQTLTSVTTDLFVVACGGRAIVGSEVGINPGNDTTNFPFHYDPVAVLTAAGHGGVASALVMGWGQTYAGPVDAPPTISATADMTIALGETVNVSATAMDAEDGPLMVRWDLLASGYYDARVTGTGPTFSFTPACEGIHQLRAWVYDSAGQMTERIISVTISNPLPQYDPIQLTPDPLTGEGIIVSPDGLSARFTGPGKMGIRANQGLLTEFQYFEVTRLRPPVNQGSGMVVQWGNLNPFDWDDVPQSLVINMQGATWQNLVPHVFSLGDASTTFTYGYAVDYRGPNPIVYAITEDGLVDTLDLYDVTTPLYPVLYGNPYPAFPGTDYDSTLNVGGTPFAYDPAAVLAAEGIDVSELQVYWGSASAP